VSGLGADTGTCARTTPCRTFAYAISQTDAGGEVDVLDSAGYGAFTIDKPISIVNDGAGEAAITPAAGANGLLIAAGTLDTVHLRGLTVVGNGNSAAGIQANGVGTLHIQNCVIRGFPNDGIFYAPVSSSLLTISDTVITAQGKSGINIQ